ncbi:Smr/MutS family protein [Haematobacter genomosp. 1]|uniref:DNA mismatch repair protein MutS n=1 Tax=Haematobacter genomosp. 1 TaxID=366618 RepID=A0A212A9S2_9RHOB|nr:Smr/MutS family protein [Haematobacter genomosp. 1]OWJ76858.1 DNA mismatch repair protein MutS [Haematobacter genomosp. 1]
MARKRRDITPEEAKLWQSVARSTLPMHRIEPLPEPEERPVRPIVPRVEEPPPVAIPAAIQAFRVGERADARRPHTLLGSLPERLASGGVRMDRRTFDQMNRGKISPEGRLDLHGMTLAEAHGALVRFVMDSHRRQRRLLLVITGKGRNPSDEGPIPVRVGALRHQVPQWLTLPPLGGLVLQVTPAHIRHGGAGAYYVYLRRNRA